MPPVSLEKHAVVRPRSGDELVTANHRGTTGFHRLAQTAGTLAFDNKYPVIQVHVETLLRREWREPEITETTWKS
jgi:hypothetical protein